MSWMSGLKRTSKIRTSAVDDSIRLHALFLASICLTLAMFLFPGRASAVAPSGETLTCEPGQTANTDLGVCQDPTC
ncbi:MAG: hypothetical protein ACHP84_03660, partial [Caulobacterales bacterium]